MNKLILYLLMCCFLSSCFAQKKVSSIEDVVLEVEEALLYIEVNDYDLKEHFVEKGFQIIVNDKGLFQFKDSTLVNAEVNIWLHDNFESDIGPNTFGNLEGPIIDGKREGKWIKKLSSPKHPHYVIVKEFHYKNGVLDGIYKVFNTDGEMLYFLEPNPSFPEEFKGFELFKSGTGWYYDYYYETGILKQKGFYKKNQKHGSWVIYDENGNEVVKEFYNKGILINH